MSCVYLITSLRLMLLSPLLNVLSAQRYLRCLSSVSTSQCAVKDPVMSMYYLCFLMVSCYYFCFIKFEALCLFAWTIGASLFPKSPVIDYMHNVTSLAG